MLYSRLRLMAWQLDVLDRDDPQLRIGPDKPAPKAHQISPARPDVHKWWGDFWATSETRDPHNRLLVTRAEQLRSEALNGFLQRILLYRRRSRLRLVPGAGALGSR